MIFWASAEVFMPADAALEAVRNRVEPFLNTQFAKTSLAELDCTLRYVPIVMPSGMREQYPARSKLRTKQRLYDCAPQLDYDVYVSGNFANQLREYIHGVATSAPFLAKLGATTQQTAAFEAIMASAVELLLEGKQERRE
jgi:hypothetical protein